MSFHKTACGIAACGALSFGASHAWGQACCAGASIVTPGRLGLHDFALVGTQLHASVLVGSFDAFGNYTGRAPGTLEDDFEQDFYGAIRVFRRGQIAVLVPLVETVRRAGTLTDGGGGLGDINLSARYDFLYAGQSRYVPGIGVLAGVTFPTGVPVESASNPLGAGATGIGAFRNQRGHRLRADVRSLAGCSIVDHRGADVADGRKRQRDVEPTPSFLATVAYVTRREIAFALSTSVTYEGDATINNAAADDSERLTLALTGGVLLPISDTWRAQFAVTWNPPLAGVNTPSTAGLVWTLVHAWL